MVKARATLSAILCAAFLQGCTVNGTMTGPNGQAVPFSIDANVPYLGQGQQVSQFPPLPPLAPGATPQAPDGSAPTSPGNTVTTVTSALPTDPNTGSLGAVPQTAAAPQATSPQTTAAVPQAPQATSQGAPGALTVQDYVARLNAQYGVNIVGIPTVQGLINLGTSLALYPAGAVRGATINFTGRSAGAVGGTWQTGGVINLYQEGLHVCTHELAHHILEQNRTRWGYQLKQLIAANPADIPMSAYARENLAQGNIEEVAAEVVSYYAEGRWVPQNANTHAALRAMISNQPNATV